MKKPNKFLLSALLSALVLGLSAQASAQSYTFKKLVPDLRITSSSGEPVLPPSPVNEASVTPAALNFGNVLVTASSTLTVNVSNSGGTALSIGSAPAVTGSNAFTLDSKTCGSSLAPGAQCSMVVRYAPSVAGEHTGLLSFSAGKSVAVSLSGSGVLNSAEVGAWDLPSKTYGDEAFELTPPDARGAGAWSFVSSDPTVVSVSGALAQIHKAGTVTLTASQSAAGADPARTITATLVVSKASPAVDPLTTLTIPVNGREALSTPASSSDGAWSFVATPSSIATVESGYVVGKAQGAATLTATQAETANYRAAQTTATVQVLPLAQASFSLAGALTTRQGEFSTPVTLTLTNQSSSAWSLGSSALKVTSPRFNLASNTCAGATVQPGASCTVGVRISGSVSGGNAPATAGVYNGTVTLSTSTQAATYAISGTVTTRDKITLSGGASRANWSDGNSALCHYQYGGTYGGSVGQYYCAGSSSYAYSSRTAQCDLCAKYLDKVATSTGALNFGVRDVNSSNAATVALLNGETFGIQVSDVAITGVTNFSATHNCASLPAGQGCAAEVTFVPTSGTPVAGKLKFTANTEGSPYLVSLSGSGQYLAVTRGALTVSPKTYGDAAFQLVAPSSTSPGPWTYASSNPAVASVAGDTVTIAGAGTTTLTASQAASGAYASGSVTASLTVAKAAPTIATWPDEQRSFGSANFTLTAPVSNSNGGWTYASSNPAVATVSGSTVTIVGVGSTTLTATQASSSNYLAGNATKVLTVAKGDPVIQTWGPFSVAASTNLTLSAPTSESTGTWTYTSSNPAIASIAGNVLTGVTQGTVTVTATQAATAQHNSATTTAQVTVTAPPAEVDPYWGQTPLLMRFNSAPFVAQGTGVGSVLNQSGSVSSNVVNSAFVNSVLLNGTDNPIQLTGAGSGGVYEPGSRDFTIEGWFTRQTLDTSLISTFQWTSGYKGGWSVSNNPNGRLQFVGALGSATTHSILALGATVIPVNTWTHFAVTRQGTTLRIFVNGVLDASATISGALRPACYTTPCQAKNLRIGAAVTDSGTFTNKHSGNLDEIRITMDVARYTSNFAPPAAPLPAN